MDAFRTILTMYVITLPLTFFAFRYGIRMLRLREPPDGPMRTLQLGTPVTDPREKLALAHQIGWGCMVAGAAFVLGTVLTELNH